MQKGYKNVILLEDITLSVKFLPKSPGFIRPGTIVAESSDIDDKIFNSNFTFSELKEYKGRICFTPSSFLPKGSLFTVSSLRDVSYMKYIDVTDIFVPNVKSFYNIPSQLIPLLDNIKTNTELTDKLNNCNNLLFDKEQEIIAIKQNFELQNEVLLSDCEIVKKNQEELISLIEEKEKVNEILNKEINVLKIEVELKTKENDLLTEKNKDLMELYEDESSKHSDLKSKILTQDNTFTELKLEHKKLKVDMNTLKSSNEKLSKVLEIREDEHVKNISMKEVKISELQSKLSSIEEFKDKLLNQVDVLNSSITSLEIRENERLENISKLQDKLSHIEKSNDNLICKLELMNLSIATLENKNNEHVKNISMKEVKISELQSKLSSIEEFKDKLLNQVDVLNSSITSLEIRENELLLKFEEIKSDLEDHIISPVNSSSDEIEDYISHPSDVLPEELENSDNVSVKSELSISLSSKSNVPPEIKKIIKDYDLKISENKSLRYKNIEYIELNNTLSNEIKEYIENINTLKLDKNKEIEQLELELSEKENKIDKLTITLRNMEEKMSLLYGSLPSTENQKLFNDHLDQCYLNLRYIKNYYRFIDENGPKDKDDEKRYITGIYNKSNNIDRILQDMLLILKKVNN